MTHAECQSAATAFGEQCAAEFWGADDMTVADEHWRGTMGCHMQKHDGGQSWQFNQNMVSTRESLEPFV